MKVKPGWAALADSAVDPVELARKSAVHRAILSNTTAPETA